MSPNVSAANASSFSKRLALSLCIVAGLSACARFQSAPVASPEAVAPVAVTQPVAAPLVDTARPELRTLENLNAVLWFQTAAEYQASALQAFQAASTHLPALIALGATAIPDEQKADVTGDFSELPPAVVVDVDETMLDNSVYMARLVRDGTRFDPETWAAFCREDVSTAVPGAVAFTQLAKALNVRVIYISNRDASLVDVTRKTMARLGFADTESNVTFAFRDKAIGWDSKGARRAHFAKTHRIIMVIGDNLGDFTEAYRSSPAERAALVQSLNRWGSSWIMLPNPMYGSWEAPFDAPDAESARSKRIQGLILKPRTP